MGTKSDGDQVGVTSGHTLNTGVQAFYEKSIGNASAQARQLPHLRHFFRAAKGETPRPAIYFSQPRDAPSEEAETCGSTDALCRCLSAGAMMVLQLVMSGAFEPKIRIGFAENVNIIANLLQVGKFNSQKQ